MAVTESILSEAGAPRTAHRTEIDTSPTRKRRDMRQRLMRHRAEDSLPHTVQHERIYIVPTRRGLAFLGTLLLMLIGSINYQLNLGYALCFLLGGLFAASLIHTYRNLAGITIRSIQHDSVHAGEALQFRIRLHNSDARDRFGITVRNAEASTRCDCRANASAEAELSVPTQGRGEHRLGRLTLSSDYPLGLWIGWSYLHTPHVAWVWPAVEPSPPPLPLARDGQGEARPQRSNSGDLAGLRPYQDGDSPTHVAWKHAARGLGLHTRMLEEIDAQGEPWLDLDNTGLSDTEARLQRLCAWLLIAQRENTGWTLDLPTQQLSADSGEAPLQHALDLLAQYDG